MKLNETTRTAINFVSELNDKPQRVEDVARKIGTTVHFLEQIARKLRIAGLVESVKGPKGGYLKSKQVNSWQVMTAVLAKPLESDPTMYGNVIHQVRSTLENIQI